LFTPLPPLFTHVCGFSNARTVPPTVLPFVHPPPSSFVHTCVWPQHRSHYVIINVPSKLIFDANVFKPSKLCAVYELDHGDLPVPPPSPPPAVEDTPWNNLGETIKDMWVEEEGGEDKVDDDDFDFENFMV